MKKCLLPILAYSLLALTVPSLALAHEKTVIYGEPIAGTAIIRGGTVSLPSLLVKTEMGFEEPVLGETDMHEALYNIPIDDGEPVLLREVPTLYITEGISPVIIDESISADNITRGLVYPGDPNPITLEDWVGGGHSKLKIKTLNNGMSKVKMKIKGLLPNSLYGVWQFNLAGGPPGPYGGIPNAFMTDSKGNATMKRTLPFNIYEVVEKLVVVYHSDHRFYGGTPSAVRTRGGPDMHFQLEFNVTEMP